MRLLHVSRNLCQRAGTNSYRMLPESCFRRWSVVKNQKRNCLIGTQQRCDTLVEEKSEFGKRVRVPSQWASKALYHSALDRTKVVENKEDNNRLFALKAGSGVGLASAFLFVSGSSMASYGLGALITAIVISEPTVGTTLSNGIQRVGSTALSGLAAYGVGFGIQMSALNPELLTCLSIFGFSALVFYGAKTKAEYQAGFIVFALTFDCVLVDLLCNGLSFTGLQERFVGVLLGLCCAMPVHLMLFPRFSGTNLLYHTESNLDQVSRFLWRAIRGYSSNTMSTYSTYFNSLNDGMSTGDCFANVMLSGEDVQSDIKSASWERYFGGLQPDDIKRLNHVQGALRRISAIGVSMDMVVTTWRKQHVQSHLAQGEFGLLVNYESTCLKLFRQLRYTLKGPVSPGQRTLIQETARDLEMCCLRLAELQDRLVELGAKERQQAIVHTIHFLALLLDMAKEVHDLVNFKDFRVEKTKPTEK